MKIKKIGRRYYLEGAPFALKEKISEAGCTWDKDERMWWTGKQAVAESILALESTASEQPESLYAIGKAQYKGKSYYLLWEGINTYGKQGYRLAFLDGSNSFWAKDGEPVTITKRYQERRSVESLIAYSKQLQQAKRSGAPVCAECGKPGQLIEDLEDGLLKHRNCCDIPPR